jgi:alanyl-tRNA synthetase
MVLLPATLDVRTRRILADHTRAIAFLISDGVVPSNKEQGYVLRRLIRRVIVHRVDMQPILALVAQQHGLGGKKIEDVFTEESVKFTKTLDRGLKELEHASVLDADTAFMLYESYGLPYEIIKDVGGEKANNLTREAFDEKFKEHQAQSRTASAGMFKGGLADQSDIVVRYHTATHLLNAALRTVLGERVMQKGSNINAERMRFDFSHPEKMTDEQKTEVERLVNEWIARDLPVTRQEMSQEEARKLGAIGAFGEKYSDVVSVYTVQDPSGEVISREFCGGPHVTHTGAIGTFRITKEEAVSAGVRRIRAVIQ